MEIDKNFLAITVKPTKKEVLEQEFVDENLLVKENVNASITNLLRNDSLVINGKNSENFADISDTELNEFYSNAEFFATDVIDGQKVSFFTAPSSVTVPPSITSTTMASTVNYKSLDDETIKNIKQAIWDLHHPKPSGDDEPSGNEGRETPETANYTLTRKNNSENNKTITVNSTETTIKLTNSVTGNDYYYYISSKSGTQSVTLRYLDNDRLIISGNNIKVESTKNQDDSIILLGDNNELNTNSGNDIVRVGYVIDSNIEGTTYQEGESVYITYQDTKNNIIDTGSGDDYVFTMAYKSNTIKMGDGNDTLRTYWDSNSSNITKTGVEHTFKYGEIDTSSDNKNSGGNQNQYGDCKLLSFINSLGDKLKDYVTITKNSSGTYNVKFNKTGYSKNISISQLDKNKNSTGDLDFVLIEEAFRLVIAELGYNMNDGEDTDDKSLGSAYNTFLITKVFCDKNAKVDMDNNIWYDWSTEDSETGEVYDSFKELFQKYISGKIDNLVLSSNGEGEAENEELGIVLGHAYAVKGGEFGKYIIVTNPWDGNDLIKLDWDDFKKYFSGFCLVGESFDYFQENFVSSSTSPSNIASPILGDNYSEEQYNDNIAKKTKLEFLS